MPRISALTVSAPSRFLAVPPRKVRTGGVAARLRSLAVGQYVTFWGKRNTDGLHGYWKHLAPMKFTARQVDGEIRAYRIA